MSSARYWNRHARNYDRSMKLLGRPIPGMVARAAEAVRGTQRVLEVAAGTGLVTPALAREAGFVLATDYRVADVVVIAATGAFSRCQIGQSMTPAGSGTDSAEPSIGVDPPESRSEP